jgi:hypothetical protein
LTTRGSDYSDGGNPIRLTEQNENLRSKLPSRAAPIADRPSWARHSRARGRGWRRRGGVFLDVAVRDLGYDIERGFRSDGSGDFGFDYLEVSEREAYVFQSKGVDAEALIEYAGENSMFTG